jgi:uncharacterized protein YyaL (SSP411 family)
MAAEALLILHGYTGEDKWRQFAVEALGTTAALVESYPAMVGHHLSTLHAMSGLRELAVVGPDPEPLSAVYWERFRPQMAFAASRGDEDRVPLLQGRGAGSGTLAYLCMGHVCNLPTADPEALRDQMAG